MSELAATEVEESKKASLSKSQTLLISALAEVFFATLALVSAILANSITLWTNATRVLLESLTCALAYYSDWKNKRVSAETFNYGLGKLENLVSLFASVVILCTFLIVGWNTVERLRNPVEVSGVGFGVIALCIAGGCNVWMFSRFWRLKQKDHSPVLDSQTVVYRNAVLATVTSLAAVLLASLFGGQAWAAYIDPAGAIILCGFLLKSGVGLMKRSIAPLLDSALEEAHQIEITRQLISHFEDYEQLGRIRTRRSGANIFVEIFLEFAPNLSHAEVLERMSRIKCALEAAVPGAEVWVIPVSSVTLAPAARSGE